MAVAMTAVDTQRVVVREMSKFSMRERKSLINECIMFLKFKELYSPFFGSVNFQELLLEVFSLLK